MGEGFKKIYEHAQHDVIVFLENDFVIQSGDVHVLDDALKLLDQVDYVRLRSRSHPGVHNFAMHLASEPYEVVNACLHLSECIYWIEDPETVHGNKITRLPFERKWYTSDSASCNYANNPYACKKSFFKENILPYCKFGANIEDELTVPWSTAGHKCAFGPGLFTHKRVSENLRRVPVTDFANPSF